MPTSFQTRYDQLTSRAHVYPPLELYTELSLRQVLDAWTRFAASPAQHKFGLYVHLPFCERKCSFCYCDTVISSELERFDRYLRALSAELELFSAVLGSRRVDSLYIGGGTPTHVGAERLDALMTLLNQHFALSPQTFVNLEATPESMNPVIAKVLQKHHTDRVTLGIQSVDEALLSELNRPQSFAQVADSVRLLRDAGVTTINFDLVGGLPGDTLASFEPRFRELLTLDPDMVHIYPYTQKPGQQASPDRAEIVRVGNGILAEHGYRSIKNDGWGKEDRDSNWQVRHKIEDGASCLGLGIRARSHIFGQLAYRSHFSRDYESTLNNGEAPQYRGFTLKLRHQVQRYLIDNLRGGVSVDTFQALFAGDPMAYIDHYHPELTQMVKLSNGQVRTTNDIRSDRQLQQLLFDRALHSRLYLQHIKQPKGWPSEAMQAPAPPSFDLNWMRFLAMKLTKGNTYPPITPDGDITEHTVQQAWANYNRMQATGKAPQVAGIYCHVPFCATKCKFCYCYSIQLDDKAKMARYVDAVCEQIRQLAPHTKDIKFSTLYFGGGTPSLLPPEQLDQLLQTIHAHFSFVEGFQFNFEGTPQTLGREGRIPILARHGATRLTIGIQSLERHLLKHMDRAQQSRIKVGEVLREAREHGIQTVNVDVLTGLPDQSMEDFTETFEQVLSWRPEVMHVYPYQNTEETRYFLEGYRTEQDILPLRSQMMAYARKRLQETGYLQAPHESWCLGEEHRNQQDVDKIVSASSVLPLGYVARGHVFGNLTYGTRAETFQQMMTDHSQRDVYYGYPITVEDDKVRFVISNLRTGFSRITYEHIFGQDVLCDFWPQLALLQQLGIVKITATEVQSLMSRSSDSIVYTKLFFSEHYHQLLRQRYADVYDPDTDYEQALNTLYERSF